MLLIFIQRHVNIIQTLIGILLNGAPFSSVFVYKAIHSTVIIFLYVKISKSFLNITNGKVCISGKILYVFC